MAKPNVIPGKKGVDYKIVTYGTVTYAVYRVQLPNGQWINTTWRVPAADRKALGLKPGEGRKINRSAFRALNVFGAISDIARGDKSKHPFQTYLDHLAEVNAGTGASWLKNKDFMGTMLMGWAENWSAEELRQRLTGTQWYKSRTDYERKYALDMSPAQRKAEAKVWEQRMREGLESLYGAGVSMDAGGFDETKFQADLNKLVQGKWGDPSDAFEFWLSQQQQQVRLIEGTAAWADFQQEQIDLASFMNRPEDMFLQLQQDSRDWLGARAVPDDGTLQGWAQRLVSAESSQADWEQFLQQQAKALYPYLGAGERFVDRASGYKRIAEEELGRPLEWEDDLLYKIGETDNLGAHTGNALSYDGFTSLVRARDDWWTGDKAAKEGFQLAAYLNETFTGMRL